MTHCSLCTPNLPQDAIYVFFDCDEVLIRRDDCKSQITSTYHQLPSTMTHNLRHRTASSLHFSQEAVQLLKVFSDENEKIGRKVVWVILSSWAQDCTLHEFCEIVFKMHFFALSIVGKVPKRASESQNQFLDTRAKQAEYWLQEHSINDENAIFIDDFDDGLSKRFPNKFVHITDNIFSHFHLEQALACVGIHRKVILINNYSINKLSFYKIYNEIKRIKSSSDISILKLIAEDPNFKNNSPVIFKVLLNDFLDLQKRDFLDAEFNLKSDAKNVLEVSIEKNYKNSLISRRKTLLNPQEEDLLVMKTHSNDPISTLLF